MVTTYIFCHDQNFILNSIENTRYDCLGKHYFVFLGFNEVDKIEGLENVIISRNLSDNIENNKHCLQYCGWYSIFKNTSLNSDYIRLIDYDVDILTPNNQTSYDIKSSMGFNFNFYFNTGFPEHHKFNDYIKNKLGFNLQFLIEKHYNKFIQDKWFSIGDVLIKTETFRNFMEWFYPVYLDNNDSNYFAHHFERYLTVYCLLNDIQYEVKENETIHRQLKSHNYYT
jgi:hypothetical protein